MHAFQYGKISYEIAVVYALRIINEKKTLRRLLDLTFKRRLPLFISITINNYDVKIDNIQVLIKYKITVLNIMLIKYVHSFSNKTVT